MATGYTRKSKGLLPAVFHTNTCNGIKCIIIAQEYWIAKHERGAVRRRLYRLVLMLKISWEQGRALGTDESNMVGNGQSDDCMRRKGIHKFGNGCCSG